MKNQLYLMIIVLLFFTSCIDNGAESTQIKNPRKPGISNEFEIFRALPFSYYLYKEKPIKALENMTESGAVTPNDLYENYKTMTWYIEQQRAGEDAVIGGLVYDDTASVNAGFKAYDWGFKQQIFDGSFGSTKDAFHSTSFFIAAVAHSISVIRQSPYAEKYKNKIEEYLPKLERAALWMIMPANLAKGIEGNKPYVHRRYLVAAALGITGQLTNNTKLIEKANEFIIDGIRSQSPVGYNPEKGGYDSSYQMVGIVYAQEWYHHFIDTPLGDSVKVMIDKAIKWEKTMVLPTGQVSTNGNTRTAGQEKDRKGIVKTVSYYSVYKGFAFWGYVTEDEELLKLAWKVATAKR